MQLLRNVKPERQSRPLRWASHAEGVGEGDGLHPFDIGFTRLRARYIDADAGPWLAPIRDRELHVDRAVVQQLSLQGVSLGQAQSPRSPPIGDRRADDLRTKAAGSVR